MAGLVMFVICWSGTVAVLSHEIDWLLNPLLRVTPQERVAGWGELHRAAVAAYPQARSVSLEAPKYPGFAAVAVLDLPAQDYVRVYLDPHTAQVLGQTSFFNVQRFFRSLHMSLFDPFGRMLGYWFVSLFGFVLLALAITPLVFYRRWWRGFMVVPGAGRTPRTTWSTMHKAFGVWGLWFTLLMGLTGAWWTFEYAGGDLGYPEPPELQAHDTAAPDLDRLMAAASSHWPQFDAKTLYLPDPGSAEPLHVVGQADAWLVRDRANWLRLDPATGAILAQQRAEQLPWPARWIDTVDPLHFGDFAGLGVKLIWFVFGLALSGMALTGAYLHYQRLHAGGTTSARHRWRGYAAAIATSAAVLALTVFGGWNEIRGYGPGADGARQWPAIAAPVLAFIVSWVAITLAALLVWCRKLLHAANAGATRAAVPR